MRRSPQPWLKILERPDRENLAVADCDGGGRGPARIHGHDLFRHEYGYRRRRVLGGDRPGRAADAKERKERRSHDSKRMEFHREWV
jgi:hypothetical protein